MTYQGWANYPTWAVHLWISNEEALWDIVLDIVRRNRHGSTWDGPDELREWVADDLLPDLGATMESDILMWAIAQVDWLEVYDAIAEAVEEEDEEDDDEAE